MRESKVWAAFSIFAQGAPCGWIERAHMPHSIRGKVLAEGWSSEKSRFHVRVCRFKVLFLQGKLAAHKPLNLLFSSRCYYYQQKNPNQIMFRGNHPTSLSTRTLPHIPESSPNCVDSILIERQSCRPISFLNRLHSIRFESCAAEEAHSRMSLFHLLPPGRFVTWLSALVCVRAIPFS
jgi:hypothetical protein